MVACNVCHHLQCPSHLHLRPHQQGMSYFRVRVQLLYTVTGKVNFMCLSVRRCRHRNNYISPGLSLFRPGKLQIKQYSNAIFKRFGVGLSAQEWKTVSFSPLHIHPFYYSLMEQHTGRVHSFPLNKPHVSSQKILCVISAGRREAQEKTWKG